MAGVDTTVPTGAHTQVGDTDPGADTRLAILAGAARCLARWGFKKTTIPDVAQEAGVSRATVYRYFPEGRDSLLLAVGVYEEGRFFAHLGPVLDELDDLSDTLTVAIAEATSWLRDHPLLAYLLEHEPEQLAPHLAFDAVGPVLYRGTSFLTPYVERFLAEDRAAEVSEWAVRVVLAYWLQPSDHLDPTRPADARTLVDRLVDVT